MDNKFLADSSRVAGYTAIGGSVTMVIGAVLWATTGTDLWAALDNSDVAGYLTAASVHRGQLITNLSVWIVGVLILNVAGTALANLCVRRPLLGQMGLTCIRVGVPLVIVSYIAQLSLLVQIGPDTSATGVALAGVVGWIGVRADDLATALIIGFAPLFFMLAARDEWAPTWLVWGGYLAGVIALFSLIVLYIPSLRPLSFTIIPVGMAWTIAAGVVLLRQGVIHSSERMVDLGQLSKEF